MMEKKLQQIKKDFQDAVRLVKNSEELTALRVKFLGRKGILTSLLRQLKNLAEVERPRMGNLANEIKRDLERITSLTLKRIRGKGVVPEAVTFDATLPGQQVALGHLHPLTCLTYQLEDIFKSMNFMVLDGPEIESEYFNFTALNIPPDHPARDTQDTFWLTDGNLLRTHTSPVQIRALLRYGAPFRGIVPGRTFRYEATDVSHDHTFYQVEGLMVDEDISIGHLVATMKAFLQQVFQASVNIRLRPGYFPFVEPGFELDMQCLICHGKGCSVCGQVGWLELIGCGLVHPEVLRAGNVNPSIFSGFAFGLGLTRLAMMKYGIDDIRLLHSSDLRFLQQF